MSDQTTKISCPTCSTVYNLPAGAISAKGRILRCSICQRRFLVRPRSADSIGSGPAIEEHPFSTGEMAELPSRETLVISDDPFSTPEPRSDLASTYEDSAIEVDSPEQLEEAGEVLESFLEVGDVGGEIIDEAPPEISDTPSGSVSVDSEASEYLQADEEEGMVEFFVEDDEGQIERIETRATEEQEATSEPVHSGRLSGEETVEMPAMKFTEADSQEYLEPEDHIVQTDADEASKEAAPRPPAEASRWRDPGRGPKRSILASEKDAKPSSGTFYLIALIFIGIGGLATNFVDLGTWRFDPIWSSALVVFGILGFFLQNLSGLYISGFFTLFHGFGLFSRQQANLENGILDGVWHVLVLFAIGFIFMTVYYLLMNRKRGHFIIQEGQGQSLSALLLGFIAILVGVYGHLVSQSIPSFASLVYMGTSLQEITYYAGVTLPVIIQSAFAATAVAIGFSAHRVRNRNLVLAVFGILLGLAVIIMLYAQMVVGAVQIALPF